MSHAPFYSHGSRVLTPGAFDFVLATELKRACRSQSFLTLVALEAQRTWDGLAVAADEGIVSEIADILGHEVRDTDIVASTGPGGLWLVLLDADSDGSRAVIERVMARIDSYRFPTPVSIAVGAASCPTHGVDADSLKREARSRPMVSARRTFHPASPMERS